MKALTREYLREIVHPRARNKLYSAVMRIRHSMALATHKFYNECGFRYIHTLIVTAADCEGAGEQFGVTILLPDKGPPRFPINPDGSIDYSKDFFGCRASLIFSGLLNVETHAMALCDMYFFGLTFRAEWSNTTRDSVEFWMIDSFADLSDDMALATDYLKYCVAYALEHYNDDLASLETSSKVLFDG